MSKTVVIFGGSGFLGSYLAEELLKRKYQVIVADIASSSTPNVKYEKCNILEKSEVEKVVAKADVVYNLAGFANLDKAVEQPIETITLNVIGNLNILEALKSKKISRFVYASSAYATSNKGSFYGISKLTSEKIVEEYHKKFNLPYTILRYGSVYSEKNFDNNYIYSLVEEAVKTNKINHKGDGEEIREYIHAVDAAKLSVDIIESTDFENIHVTLTGVEKMKRSELFNMINEMLGQKVKIELANDGYKAHYKYTPYSFDPSVSKKLVANPYIDMGQGILECIKAVHNNEK